jgi:membrane protein implicated in regulation of membrane protease activity
MSFDDLAFWHWFALATIFIIIEVFVPGIAFLWLGIAAIVTGVGLLIFPELTIEIQVVIFAVVAVITTVTARMVIKRTTKPSDRPDLNQRSQSHVGSVYLLVDETQNGHGKVHIGDTVWSIKLAPGSAELPAGSSVKVIEVDGATLVVQAADRNGGAQAPSEGAA